jgi:hypothetical protein
MSLVSPPVQMDTYVYEPPGSGSVIICTDPDPDLDPDLSINSSPWKMTLCS